MPAWGSSGESAEKILVTFDEAQHLIHHGVAVIESAAEHLV